MCGKADETPRSNRTPGIRRHSASARRGLPFSGLIKAKQDEDEEVASIPSDTASAEPWIHALSTDLHVTLVGGRGLSRECGTRARLPRAGTRHRIASLDAILRYTSAEQARGRLT